MAGDWIKMRTDLHDDAEVRQIARELDLGGDLFAVVGRLHRIWGWADRQTADGIVKGIVPSDIDALVGTPGFASAMNKVGWLVCTTKGIRFPHFTRHSGQSAKRRADDQLRKARSRASEPVRTQRGQTADQRREEKRTGEKSNARTVSNTSASVASTPTDADNPVGVGKPAYVAAFPRELLRVVDAINLSPISQRRRGSIARAAMVIAETRNPMPIWKAITRRAHDKKNPGGYIANAMVAEANERGHQ